MAKLSERVEEGYTIPEGYIWSHSDHLQYDEYRSAGWNDEQLKQEGLLIKVFTAKIGRHIVNSNIVGTLSQENTNMNNTLRTLNITLLDLSPELKGEKKVVFEKQNVRTEYNDDQTIQNILATGDVLSSLELHNENVRRKTLDSQYKGSAREVYLEDIDHIGDSRLKWEVVRVG